MRAPMVEVTWHDACMDPKASTTKEAKRTPLHERRTVGYLLFQDDARIVIAQDWNAHNRQWENVWAIPAPWTLKEVLGVPAP